MCTIFTFHLPHWIYNQLTYMNGNSSLRGGGGGTYGTPFLPRILCLFCCYVTNFKGYFLFSYLFKCNCNLCNGFFTIFILAILFLFSRSLPQKYEIFREIFKSFWEG